MDANITQLNTKSVYYRLKLVDGDGAYTYSKIIELAVGGNRNKLNVYPNPASNVLYIQLMPDEEQVFLHDATGRTISVITANPGDSYVQVDVSKLNKGIYILKSGTGSATFIRQ